MRRESVGLSTMQLANKLHDETGATWSQSKVSKIERGKTSPSETDVAEWVRATGGSPTDAAALVEVIQSMTAEATVWRDLFSRGVAANQKRYRELNERATYIAIYQPAIIPGLVQVVDYARAIFELFGVDPTEAAAAAEARKDRQNVLDDARKSIDLFITEAALRLQIGGADVMRAQYARLLEVGEKPNVNLGIIPAAAAPLALPLHAFVVRDIPPRGRVITVETLTAELNITTPEDVRRFTDDLERHRATAVLGGEAAALIHAADETLP